MKKPYIILSAGILLLALAGGLYMAYWRQPAAEQAAVMDKEQVEHPVLTPAPPTVAVRAVAVSSGQVGLAMAPKAAAEEQVTLSAISFKAELSTDLAAGMTTEAAKLTVDSSFKSAGWQLIHNKVMSDKGKIIVEIAGVFTGKKFILDDEQIIGTINIGLIPDSAKPTLRLDPEATKFLAAGAMIELQVITDN